MPGKVRRILTGISPAGRSIIESDTQLPTADTLPDEPLRAGMWRTDSTPASNTAADPMPAGISGPIAPPPHGTVFRITEILPDRNDPGQAQSLASRGANVTPDRSARHPGFHQTNTLDYAICLEGEVWAVLDEGETLMKPGDVLIQRGTYHAWSNRSGRPCRMAFVLIDAEPIQQG